MKTRNHVQLIGYAGNEIKFKKEGDDHAVFRMSIATDLYVKSAAEELIKKTTWHKIIAFRNLAEQMNAEVITGSHVLIEGYLNHRSFITGKAEKRQVTEIVAQFFMNLDR